MVQRLDFLSDNECALYTNFSIILRPDFLSHNECALCTNFSIIITTQLFLFPCKYQLGFLIARFLGR